MLIEFSVGNFRSFKEVQTLSFVAAPIKSKYPELDKQNVFEAGDKLKLLKTVGMYGANGSGKSNLVKALFVFLIMIKDSFKDENLGNTLITPFYFNSLNIDQPTFFQIIIEIGGKKFRYGFEVKGNIIHSEWLIGTALNNEVNYFTREFQKIKINKSQFTEGLGLENKTKETNLFLNIAYAFNGLISKQIKEYLGVKMLISSGLDDAIFKVASLQMLENEKNKKKILNLMAFADIGLEDLRNIEVNSDKSNGEHFHMKADSPTKMLASERNVYNSQGEFVSKVYFDFEDNESEGTKKYFAFSGAITLVIEEGATLFLDEFDARLHPLLTKKIVELFNSPKSNPKNAQLFFVTHDTNLLDPKLLRRDQIYFAEKNAKGESTIYSLTDLNGVRNDASFEKDYIQGKYGAIPFLGGFNKLLGD